MPAAPLVIAGHAVHAGERSRIDIPLPNLYTQTPVIMPVHVIRGRRAGPRLFITASIHGDEINGVEIIRRLLLQRALRHLRGTLIAVPVVNVYGYVRQSRYLPDRRDLNRSFPGSDTGSLAARLAATLISEIVEGSTHGIDLHTGALHRENLPQIRAALNADDGTRELAEAFGTSVILDADGRPGSLRAVAASRAIPLILYEGGEALRFDDAAVRVGLRGILGVMRRLEMISGATATPRGSGRAVVVRSSSWVRAEQSGILLSLTPLGAKVRKGDVLGTITDPFRPSDEPVLAPCGGIVIGRTNLPLVTEGEGLYHIARLNGSDTKVESAGQDRHALDPEDEERQARL
jgi:uncharacterized protein